MTCVLKAKAVFAATVLLWSEPPFAAERWSCEFSSYSDASKEQADFEIVGDHLIEHSGDAIVDYQVLTNSKTAIVAAKGGDYASEPWLMGFLVLIHKATGKFVLTTASVGHTNAHQVGLCHLIRTHSRNSLRAVSSD